MATTERVSFPGHDGSMLDARLELPDGTPRAHALFAHCFSCSKDTLAASRVSRYLVQHGIAVLRFDFTGLGNSDGDFSNTNFSTNVDDLVAAANWLKNKAGGALDLMIGHSLGGAAVIVAAAKIPEVRAVATINAPSDAEHVLHQFYPALDQIEAEGSANVTLAGQPFTIKKQFVEDVRDATVMQAVSDLKRPLLIMHSPTDNTVGVESATQLFVAAKHPKSFVSLDGADHLLQRRSDADFVADTIAAWASRYISAIQPSFDDRISAPDGNVRASETGEGPYANIITAGAHQIRSDEPTSVGGLDTGPTPTQLLDAALASCTSITMRMYLDHKGWDATHIAVDVYHTRADVADDEGWKSVTYHRTIKVEGDLSEAERSRLIEIANKCPVHKMLHHASNIETRLLEA